jgi:hypothetical protein
MLVSPVDSLPREEANPSMPLTMPAGAPTGRFVEVDGVEGSSLLHAAASAKTAMRANPRNTRGKRTWCMMMPPAMLLGDVPFTTKNEGRRF